MNFYRNYLDNKGCDLAKTTEFLQYYALPYVSRPRDHPYFKNLFTYEWKNEVIQKL